MTQVKYLLFGEDVTCKGSLFLLIDCLSLYESPGAFVGITNLLVKGELSMETKKGATLRMSVLPYNESESD